jgi:hypothetical protein
MLGKCLIFIQFISFFFGELTREWFDACTSFQVKKKQFFRNFMTITLFGAVGTLISFIIISLGILFFKHPIIFLRNS